MTDSYETKYPIISQPDDDIIIDRNNIDKISKRIIEFIVYWFIGLLVYWFIGLLVYWFKKQVALSKL